MTSKSVFEIQNSEHTDTSQWDNTTIGGQMTQEYQLHIQLLSLLNKFKKIKWQSNCRATTHTQYIEKW